MSGNARPRHVDSLEMRFRDAGWGVPVEPTESGHHTQRSRHARRSWLRAWAPTVLASLTALTVGVVLMNAAVGRPARATADSISPPTVTQPTRAAGAASRDQERALPSLPAPSAADSGPPPAATTAPPKPPAARPPVHHAPVAGLSQVQTDNAVTIVDVGRRRGLPERAFVVALVTALQESGLRNLANPNVPASLKLPNEGVERDADSLGLFQQRPSKGWGTAGQLMDPPTSAALFYAKLVKVPNWETKAVGAAAQAVQISAFPGAYDKHVALAQRIVAAL